MRRTLTLFLAAVILVCTPGAALAANDGQASAQSDIVVSPMMVYIGYASCALSISGSGYADMSALMDCYSPVNKIRIVENLQRNEGGTWTTVASWSQYYYSNNASWSKGYYVTSGYEYRLYCSFYCYIDSTLAESTSRASYDTY